jgi:hypothetical protein
MAPEDEEFDELLTPPPPILAAKPVAPGAFVLPPEGAEKKPAYWPEQIEFRGILPNATLYKPIDDPAYAHLTQISKVRRKANKGIRVFRLGLHPSTWLHPNSPLQRLHSAKIRKAAATQRGDHGESGGPHGSERELSADKATTRALSRQFANATPEQLRAITDRVLELAGRGDKDALSYVLRMETMLAKTPLDEGKAVEDESESLRRAREAVVALADKKAARLPDGACPWCYDGPDKPAEP